MTPGTVLAWCGVALAVAFTILIIGLIVYGVIKSVRDANRARRTFNDSNTIYTATRIEDQ